MKNPIKVVQQADGVVKYIGKDAGVVLNKVGKVIMHTATRHGAIGSGQTMPASSWFCSIAAATMRETPMP